jgi:hypothetical protein
MYKLMIAAAAAAFAGPVLAQPSTSADEIEEQIVRAIPEREQVEAMAPALDRMLGAFLTIDVGPIIDAADPYRRGPDYGRRGRTLGALGGRDDPEFEDRLRSSVYTATADMGRMMGAFETAAPALARSLVQMRDALGAAIEEYERRPLPRRDR